MKKLNLIIAGVGGQGVVLASDIIGDAAIAAGYDVKKTDTLGMAQRGGSVISHIRIALQVWSPLIKEGEADIMLAFEKLESARWAHYLRSQGLAIVNNQTLPPLTVNIGSEQYPGDDRITAILKQRTDRLYYIDGTLRAKEMGNVRTFNTFLLGCLSLLMPFKVNIWKDSIVQHLAPGIQKINLAAFDQGRKEMRSFGL
ncbi:indolepyruvate oxidoreductase subunit beta [Chloroflexota bacterium]